jgi:predicted AlkP superfamily pyrophosphatase or phosphodiesterase
MVSVDGMRYDFARKYQAKHLLAFANAGVQATSMMPAYPSITFPNHYTLVTGLYPAHTGLVSNRFYDRKFNASYSSKLASALQSRWYGGTPLWVLAEQQQMVSAAFYWVGSDTPIQGIYPTYHYPYSEKININTRINEVVKWLKLPPAVRPHLINLYFPEVDQAGHHFGPESDVTRRAVLFIDSAVNELQKAVKATGLKVNFVVLSDHGMLTINNRNPLPIPALIDTSKFRITGEDVLVGLYAKNKAAIPATYKALLQDGKGKYKVYLNTNTPTRWHYNKANDRYNRIGDILLVPDTPNVFVYVPKTPNPGAHGYDPVLVKQMQAIFYVWGPDFKTRLTIPTFNNVDVYPMVTQLLGLKINGQIDGSKQLARSILIKKPLKHASKAH